MIGTQRNENRNCKLMLHKALPVIPPAIGPNLDPIHLAAMRHPLASAMLN